MPGSSGWACWWHGASIALACPLSMRQTLAENSRSALGVGFVEAEHVPVMRAPAKARGEDPRSELARVVGAKGYHDHSVGVYTRR